MHQNIARAYDYLQNEHDRVRAACVKILSQNDKVLERHLLRATLDSSRHQDEILLCKSGCRAPRGDAFLA